MDVNKEIKDLNPEEFIQQKVEEISATVGNGPAVNALSGGVDSSTVTMLGHLALGDRLKTVFIDNGLMRKGEPNEVASLFEELGVKVEIVNAKNKFFDALKGLEDPEEKREAITRTFYRNVFGKIVRKSGARYLLQGTILTDVEETVAGIKRQHNVIEQLGINPEDAFGYKIIEPLVQLRKDGVREIAKALGLPKSVYNRMPFPGPALAARIIGEVTPEKVKLVRQATFIVEGVLKEIDAFQKLAVLHQDRVTGIRSGRRNYGFEIEVRCWNSVDAREAIPTRLPWEIIDELGYRIPAEIPEVVSVTYNIGRKPPSAMEAI